MSHHFHVGSNLSGYLPSGDVLCFLDYASAADQVAFHARELADAFDDEEPQDAAEDDQPTERAAVDAALTDDPPRDGEPWSILLTDPRGWGHAVWLAVVADEDCDHGWCEHDTIVVPAGTLRAGDRVLTSPSERFAAMPTACVLDVLRAREGRAVFAGDDTVTIADGDVVITYADRSPDVLPAGHMVTILDD